MAELHRFRPPPRRRRPMMSCDLLAWLAFLAGGLAAFAAYLVPGLGGFSTLIGLGVAVGGYMALYDRCQG